MIRAVKTTPSLLPLPTFARDTRWLQIGLLTGVWALASWASRSFHLHLPGSVVGLLLVWALLETEVVSASWLERGADTLLNHMMLFFVPAMLGVVDHRELLSMTGLKLLAAVLAGTLVVMVGTAAVVELGFRLQPRPVPAQP